MNHLTDGDVEGFLSGGLPPEDLRRAVRHLASGCLECGARVRAATIPMEMFLPPGPPPDEDAYDACIDRALKEARSRTRRWKKDQERLERGLGWVRERNATFSGLTGSQMQTLVPWIRVEILLQISFDLRYSDPWRMLDLAESAQKIADGIEETPYGPAFLADLRARAWSELANASRVNEQFRRAEGALRQARSHMEQGAGDPMLKAFADEVEASLRKDQRRFGESCALLNEVYRTYLELGELHLAGRTLTSQGINLAIARQPAAAVPIFRQALGLLEVSQDPKLFTSTQYNLVDALVDSGDLHEAVRLLVITGLREKLAEDPLNKVRLRWVEGKILARRERLEEAEEVFAEVRAGFRQQGLEYVAAVAGVDQAIVLLRQGKQNEAHLLAYDLWVTFHRHEVHEEADRALAFLEVVCRLKVVTVKMAEGVRSFLDQAQDNRRMRFDLLGMARGGELPEI
jgi:tetratricopeptide (TPR) repeat protein